jgi:hypothetical protein
MALFESLVTTIVGAGSEQVLHLHGPIGGDEVAQRFAAIRIGDFVSTLIEPIEQGKAWFILIDTPGDPTTTLRWVEREVAATLCAVGRAGHMSPANLFMLVSAGEAPSQPQRCWLSLAGPQWDTIHQPSLEPRVPPVGYQRQLLDNQLTGPVYRSRLREAQAALKLPPDIGGLSAQMLRRWLAASVDDRQHGIWIASDPAANARYAVEALEALHLAPSCSV